MATKAEKILELLGQGLDTGVVATAVGVEPGYVSQLLADPLFHSQVTEKRMLNLTAETERDRSWSSLEDKILLELHEKIDDGMINKTADLLRIAHLANHAERRGAGTKQAPIQMTKIVELNIPPLRRNVIDITPNGEVVEVEGRSLITMGTQQLLQEVAKRKGETSEGNFTRLEQSIVQAG